MRAGRRSVGSLSDESDQRDRQRADRQVDVEDPAPRQVVGEHAAEQRPGHAGDHEDHLDVALVAPTLARGHDLGDDRHRERHQPAGAQALEGAEADQLGEVLSGAAQRRTGEEHGDRGEEERLAAVEVARAAPQRHRDGGAEQIGGDDPRKLVDPAEVADDRRQRRGHDRLVERREQHRQQQAGEGRAEVGGCGLSHTNNVATTNIVSTYDLCGRAEAAPVRARLHACVPRYFRPTATRDFSSSSFSEPPLAITVNASR